MNLFLIFCLFFVSSFGSLLGHEGHKEMNKIEQEKVQQTQTESAVNQYAGRPQTWLQWLGSFHFIFLHFPIALIVITVVSEGLFVLYSSPIFDGASRFMLISAAILSFPTALLGLAYSYTAPYDGLLADFLWWHMWLGFTTAIFAIIVAFLREYGRNKIYYACLFLLFLLVNITGYLGGGMTFGPYQMMPPAFS